MEPFHCTVHYAAELWEDPRHRNSDMLLEHVRDTLPNADRNSIIIDRHIVERQPATGSYKIMVYGRARRRPSAVAGRLREAADRLRGQAIVVPRNTRRTRWFEPAEDMQPAPISVSLEPHPNCRSTASLDIETVPIEGGIQFVLRNDTAEVQDVAALEARVARSLGVEVERQFHDEVMGSYETPPRSITMEDARRAIAQAEGRVRRGPTVTGRFHVGPASVPLHTIRPRRATIRLTDGREFTSDSRRSSCTRAGTSVAWHFRDCVDRDGVMHDRITVRRINEDAPWFARFYRSDAPDIEVAELILEQSTSLPNLNELAERMGHMPTPNWLRDFVIGPPDPETSPLAAAGRRHATVPTGYTPAPRDERGEL